MLRRESSRRCFKVLQGGHAACRVVGTVEEDGACSWGLLDEMLDIIESGRNGSPAEEEKPLCAAPLDVGAISRKMRTEHQHGIARVKKRLTEELLEDLGFWPATTFVALMSMPYSPCSSPPRRRESWANPARRNNGSDGH